MRDARLGDHIPSEADLPLVPSDDEALLGGIRDPRRPAASFDDARSLAPPWPEDRRSGHC